MAFMDNHSVLSLRLALTHEERAWVQQICTEKHYLARRLHPCSRPLAYLVMYGEEKAGVLVFGRMQSTRCQHWYGNLRDLQSGWAQRSYWEILALMRVWLDPRLQYGGEWCKPELVPGFYDRKGRWRSSVASTMVQEAIERARYEYLLIYPPRDPNEGPWELAECISYCQSERFLCTLYLASAFTLFRENRKGLRTYRKILAPLSPWQREKILEASRFSVRARLKRAEHRIPVQQALFRRRRTA